MSKAKEIRQQFRLLMNGVTAQSLREKGMDYHLNWGASLGHLRELADEYGKDYDTATELWNDDVRESKIMATLLMPHDMLTRDMAMQWIGQTKTQEIAEVASMNLYQHLPYAAELAMSLTADGDAMTQLHGYCIVARLLTKGWQFSDTELHALAVRAEAVVNDADAPLYLRHAANNTLKKMEK